MEVQRLVVVGAHQRAETTLPGDRDESLVRIFLKRGELDRGASPVPVPKGVLGALGDQVTPRSSSRTASVMEPSCLRSPSGWLRIGLLHADIEDHYGGG